MWHDGWWQAVKVKRVFMPRDCARWRMNNAKKINWISWILVISLCTKKIKFLKRKWKPWLCSCYSMELLGVSCWQLFASLLDVMNRQGASKRMTNNNIATVGCMLLQHQIQPNRGTKLDRRALFQASALCQRQVDPPWTEPYFLGARCLQALFLFVQISSCSIYYSQGLFRIGNFETSLNVMKVEIIFYTWPVNPHYLLGWPHRLSCR